MEKRVRTKRKYKDGETLSKKQPIYLLGITSIGMYLRMAQYVIQGGSFEPPNLKKKKKNL